VRDAILGHNAAWRLLEPAWGIVKLDEPIRLDREGALQARLFPVPGKVPGYLRDAVANDRETCVGVRVTDTRTGHRIAYVPGLRSLDAGTLAELEAASCHFVDGTFFTGDELRALRPGAPDAVAMGHLPIAGAEGSLARLAEIPGRTLYIHMNNTNPVLDADSPEAAEVARAGVEIASDGQEFEV
jgi:pyrroloquinoline quinone biosynthesis protein B